MKILIACEESQATTKAFRAAGFEAYSCDLLPCSGGHPEWHIQGDALKEAYSGKYGAMIAHPPCTFLAGSAVQWLSHPEDKALHFDLRRPHPKYANRREDMRESLAFVKALHDAPIDFIAIENPVGLLSSLWRKPDQIVQPYHFGDEATKTTCLWLKGLPKLEHTNVVDKGARVVFSSGKSHPAWYAEALKLAKTKEERQTLRSKTFPGMAEAFAAQWGAFLELM